MQNTFSQSGNYFKWFSKKSFFRIGMWNLRLPTPFIEKTILNFHFDYLIIRLRQFTFLTEDFMSGRQENNKTWGLLLKDLKWPAGKKP